jgi:rRNA processing protein Gar1
LETLKYPLSTFQPNPVTGRVLLRRLGKPLHLTPSNNLILKPEYQPRVGETVVDNQLKSIGIVTDIFGPVKTPYITIKPTIPNPKQFLNHILYTLPMKSRRE